MLKPVLLHHIHWSSIRAKLCKWVT